jgi:hypothetical protein
MSFEAEKLYALLPALYRIRDAKGDGALKALVSVIAEQMDVIEENLDQLYDDQFIETCAEWVVPYIGDLVGARGVISFPDAPFSLRGQVAKTIAYRRRKGTAAVLEELAFDVTGWKANVVEYFQRLAATQFLNHLRPDNLSVAPVRGRKLLEYINTPFDTITHSVDVRNIEQKRGKYNIPNIGIYLWRIQSFPLRRSPAYRVDDRRYTFDALGKNTALYNRVESEDDIVHLAEPINVPMPIRRMVFREVPEMYYGDDKSVLIIGDGNKILPDEDDEALSPPAAKLSDLICICNLSDIPGGSGTVPDWGNMPDHKIAIDPVLGRIALPPGSPPQPMEIEVDYYYGFSAAIGGGGYKRGGTFSADLTTVIKVPEDAATIDDALTTLGNASGVIEITNSDYHDLPPTIAILPQVMIEVRAAEECRPILIVKDELKITGGEDAEVIFNGLLFCGGIVNVPFEVNLGKTNELHAIHFKHCTLTPGLTPFDSDPSIPVNPRLVVASADTVVIVEKSIVGGMRVDAVAAARITDSIIDAGDKTAVAYGGPFDVEEAGALIVENSTIIGKVKTTIMTLASNTIFYAEAEAGDTQPLVMVKRLQEGCVRFSYVPIASRVPRPYHCQPATEAEAPGIKPMFTSLRYGDAGYCQLSSHSAPEIRLGAENDMEMGVFYHLYQPLREYNLRTRLNEYLRFGLEAGIYYGS